MGKRDRRKWCYVNTREAYASATCHIQVHLVLRFEYMHVEPAGWSMVLDCPGTKDRVLILGGKRKRGKRRRRRGK